MTRGQRLTTTPDTRVEPVNVELEPGWSPQPGSDRNPLGAALRRAMCRRSELPTQLSALLNRLEQVQKKTKEDGMPRELIDTGSDKRFVRRDKDGKFKESDDVGRSLAQDQKRDSQTKPAKGEGDKGDR